MSFIDRLQTVTVAIMSGDDITGFYLSGGFPFYESPHAVS